MKILLSILALSFLSLPCLASEVEIMPVSAIKPGMKGYGLTVFEGSKPERFDVEVVGVLINNEPHQDLIVVRSAHPILSHTGICGGMSGSPVYIDGKLIGAASRFFKLFPKDLLTGVTPIQRMIADGKRQANPTDQQAKPQTPTEKPQNAGGISLEPIPLPFALSGAGTWARQLLQEELAPYGIEIISGGSGQPYIDDPETPTDLQPGDAFGVVLMRGDIDFSSGGTITYRDDKQVLGFGHPFFMAGDIEMPMTTARVFTVMSSLQRSDKMQIPLHEVGAITIDRQSCVAGVMGKKADMIPITINTTNTITGAQETFQCEMIRHTFLSPLLYRVALLNAVESAEATIGSTTVDQSMQVFLEGYDKPVQLNETFALSNGAANMSMANDALILIANPFAEVKLKKITADLQITHEIRTAEISAAWLDINEVKPGEALKINVELRPYNKEPERILVELKVPENLPDEDYDVEIAAGAIVAPDIAQPLNVADLVNFLETRYKSSDLVTVMELGTIGTRQEGKELRQLPFSVFGTLFSSTSAGITVAPDTLRIVTPTPYVLRGKKNLRIRVSTKGGE